MQWANQIQTLRKKLGFTGDSLDFLKYSLNLESGEIFDHLRNKAIINPIYFYTLLTHYAKANPTEKGNLKRFGDMPGGKAYEAAFKKRAIAPIADLFGSNLKALVEAAKLLNGFEVKYRDIPVEIPALPKIPLTYIVWGGDEEIQASSNILFDSSASHYLPTEDLAVLGELTTLRLKGAWEKLVI
jgi:hypothetical protein